MPSPFPGIDPYLEAQKFWEGFHAGFVTYCRDALNDALPESYVAELDEHLRLVDLSGLVPKLIVPDVAVVKAGQESSSRSRHRKKAGGTLTLEPVTMRLPRDTMEVRGVWIEIRRLPKRTPVAVIEVLSPTNKSGDGSFEYKMKRQAMIRQRVHLIELDLLLGGKRLTMGAALPRGDYYVLVSRADRRPDCDVYAWTIRDPLPTIPIPLAGTDPAVVLDLGPVFATAYERGRYSRLIDYSSPLTLLRKSEDRGWAEGIARRGRR
jgi:hypothetical protein